jgi:hypothetical protein
MDGLFRPGIAAAFRRAMTEPETAWTGPDTLWIRLQPSRAAKGFAVAAVVALIVALALAMSEGDALPAFLAAAALARPRIFGPVGGQAVIEAGQVTCDDETRPLAAFAGLRPWQEWDWLAALNRAPLAQGPAAPLQERPARDWLLLEPRHGGAAIPLLVVTNRRLTWGEIAAFVRRLDVTVLPGLRG